MINPGERVETANRIVLEQYFTEARERARFAVDHGVAALKALAIVNGGAIVALLALVGSLAQGSGSLSKSGVGSFWDALAALAIGLSLAVGGSVLSAVAYWLYAEAAQKDAVDWYQALAKSQPCTVHKTIFGKLGNVAIVGSLMLAIGSLISFCVGAYDVSVLVLKP